LWSPTTNTALYTAVTRIILYLSTENVLILYKYFEISRSLAFISAVLKRQLYITILLTPFSFIHVFTPSTKSIFLISCLLLLQEIDEVRLFAVKQFEVISLCEMKL